MPIHHEAFDVEIPMGILPDWMIEKHVKIEPFAPQQHRPGIISYGVTSYGYDVRVDRHFKVFTNVWGSTVDPKQFDPKSFVDVEGDHCIIPPNSFALAETIEYFDIPRDILVVCVGKSTYARCFSGSTRVALVDGTSPTLEEMATRFQKGESFWGYSLGAHGRIIVTELMAPRYIGRDRLLEITLDDGSQIEATPDHLFILRDGRSLEANLLRPGQSLMPLYRDVHRGYEMVYQPINGHLYPSHRLADEWNLRAGLYPDAPGTHRHHIDHDRRNNRPWNLERVPASDHIRYHNTISYGEDFDPAEHSESIRTAFERLRQDPEWVARFSDLQSERALQFWNDPEHAEARAKLIAARQNMSAETRNAMRESALRRYADPAERARQSELMRQAWAGATDRRQKQAAFARSINLRSEITAEVVRAALDQTGSIRGAARMLNCDRSVFRRFPEVVHAFAGRKVRNHKVAAIRELPGDHDVYCLTVPEAGNFALEAGVFVHNCGIIVNVTPLEPEWRGRVTIEISNTTPLPAKIYSGEGIAQMLFFRGEQVCKVSYADKKGKYQDQKGLTLPFVAGSS
jgi:deoxycytidine triphosphate deaminase